MWIENIEGHVAISIPQEEVIHGLEHCTGSQLYNVVSTTYWDYLEKANVSDNVDMKELFYEMFLSYDENPEKALVEMMYTLNSLYYNDTEGLGTELLELSRIFQEYTKED